MAGKIPVRLVEIKDEAGKKNIEAKMNMGDFESSSASIRTAIIEFKESYAKAIKSVTKVDDFGAGKKRKRKVSTMYRWRACKILSDFNREAANKFVIANYKEAYSRDFGIPMRSIRTYLDFGSVFSEGEILEEIPYSIYAEFVFKANELRRSGSLDSEKEWLLDAAKSGRMPNRDEYRKRLKSATS